MSDGIRFYYSFRSPYAWLAMERLDSELGGLGVEVESIPIFPTPENVPNDPSRMEQKVAYLVQDVRRLAREQGLQVAFPRVPDCDWSLSHAAALGASRNGRALPLILELFRQRFVDGNDLGQDAVIAAAAELAGFDPSTAVGFAHSRSLRDEVRAGWDRGIERDGIFGVPSFVFNDKLYWGQDRMHFLRSAVERKTA